MDGLGRVMNVVPTADAVWVSLVDAEAVTFVCVNADTYTLSEATDAAGTGAAALATIDHYYANANADGSTAWTAATQTAGSTVAPASGVVAFTVHSSELTDGNTHVRVASAATGLVYAITHDLNVQRAPENLPAVSS